MSIPDRAGSQSCPPGNVSNPTASRSATASRAPAPSSSRRSGSRPGRVFDVPNRQGRPAGLMAGAQAPAGFAVKVFVEQNKVAPMRVSREAGIVAVTRTSSGLRRAGKCAASRRASSCATSWRFMSCPEPVGHSTFRLVAVKMVIAFQRLDQQVIDRKPDRPAPVRVAAEEPGGSIRPARSRRDAPLRPARNSYGCRS